MRAPSTPSRLRRCVHASAFCGEGPSEGGAWSTDAGCACVRRSSWIFRALRAVLSTSEVWEELAALFKWHHFYLERQPTNCGYSDLCVWLTFFLKMSEGANSFLDMRDFSDGPVMARTPTNVISDNILMCGYLEECAQHSKLILSMTNDWRHKSHARVKENHWKTNQWVLP